MLSCPPPFKKAGGEGRDGYITRPRPLRHEFCARRRRSYPLRAPLPETGPSESPVPRRYGTAPAAARRGVAFTMSAIGMTAPVSLLTIMTETRMVSGRRAFFSSSTVILPSWSGCKYVTSKPFASSFCMGCRTAWCSTAVVMMWRPRLPRRSAAERMAQLSASVPPEVKNTRSGSAPRAAATACRACRRRWAASIPRA